MKIVISFIEIVYQWSIHIVSDNGLPQNMQQVIFRTNDGLV